MAKPRTLKTGQRIGHARAISSLLPDAGGASFRRFGFVQSAVVTRWSEIVGARYAAVSAPESIRFARGKRAAGTLTLVVEGAYASMMQHVAPDIAERVNRFFGYEAVARVSFRQGRVAANANIPAKAPPSLRPLPRELGESLREVADPELRTCLEGLAQGLAASEGPPVFADLATIPLLGKLSKETVR